MKNNKNTTIAVIGSHSALDVCRGAKEYGLRTLVIAQKGREKTYDHYYRTNGTFGCVDECLIVESFKDILSKKIQKELMDRSAIFIPHRSFEVYLDFDYQAIEKEFRVPIFGNRFLLKIEERGRRPNQYDLLDEVGIRYPKQFQNPQDIDRLCLVKVLEKERGFERAFFLVQNEHDYSQQVRERIKKGYFTKAQVDAGVIEEFVLGAAVNFNFFYSPLYKRLELIGTDTRRQTNLEGLMRLPAPFHSQILKKVAIKYEEAGHQAVTVLESLLEPAFELGERLVKAAQKLYPPGIIGPFALQCIVTPGPPRKEIVVIDVSPRMPGSPGIMSTPYSRYLFGTSLSMGDRIALEVSQALKNGETKRIIT